MSLMANHRVRGVSRCQWLYVAVGTPRKTMGLNRLSSLGESSQQPVDWPVQPSEQGWSRLGTLAHSDRATTKATPRRTRLGRVRGVPVCMLASPVVGFTSTRVVYETRPPDQRPTAPHPTPAICLCNATAHFGWLVGCPLSSPRAALSDPVAPRDRRPNGVPVRKLGGKR